MTQNQLKIGAIILSRYDSTRLPGKALTLLGEKPLIQWPIDALRQMPEISTVIATSSREVDNPIVEYAEKNNVAYFRGDLNNVAERTLACSEHFQFDYFLRINGDSPFVNKNLLLSAINIIKENAVDFVTNLIDRTYPYGLSCELIKTSTFKRFYTKFSDFQKEHITNFYYNNIKELTFAALPTLTKDYSAIDWAIDTPEDLERVTKYLKHTSITNISEHEIEELIEDYKKLLNKIT